MHRKNSGWAMSASGQTRQSLAINGMSASPPIAAMETNVVIGRKAPDSVPVDRPQLGRRVSWLLGAEESIDALVLNLLLS